MLDCTDLAALRPGQRGRVLETVGHDEVSWRLLEMGLTPGAEVRMIGTAPLGDPVEVEIRGYRLSIRKAEAQKVQIHPLN